MKNTLKIDHDARTIVMDRTFAKYAENTMSDEYAHLQRVRKDYPNYSVIQRQIKRNSNKKTYNGLTYEYMEMYIQKHDDEEGSIMNEYLMLRGKTEDAAEALAESFSYKEMRDWFLKKFPAIASFHEARAKLVA